MTELRGRISVMNQAHVYRTSWITTRAKCACGEQFQADADEWIDTRADLAWQWAQHLADVAIRELGLHQTTSGQYATRCDLTDAELDAAGFTYHQEAAE